MSEFLSSFQKLSKESFFDKTEDKTESFAGYVSRNNLQEDHSSKSNKCRILKTLLHGRCIYDCAYCRVCKNKNPLSLKPKELSDYFLSMNKNGIYDGIFLSSGIPESVDSTMQEIIETGERIRRGGFNGYIHLKILPGAARSDIKAASEIANRISLNIETTSKSRMSEIASVKDYMCDILKRQDWIASEAPGRHTTQIVVGAAGEDDREIINCMSRLYKTTRPARIYFSPFRAQKYTPLEKQEDTKKWRTNRLYQTDYLIREYHYRPEEFCSVLNEENFLTNTDPKILLAGNAERTDINIAGYFSLMRIPGVGKKGAGKICRARKNGSIKDTGDLAHLNIILKKAHPYIILGNKEYQSSISDFLQT
ncbi:MAG: radical SAM protein [Methanomicrobium sp.]|nr:radical SAM protein [Methanomicrobium sp.]MDD4126282.1 radical SAM protein [Methanomicrobium sp.]